MFISINLVQSISMELFLSFALCAPRSLVGIVYKRKSSSCIIFLDARSKYSIERERDSSCKSRLKLLIYIFIYLYIYIFIYSS